MVHVNMVTRTGNGKIFNCICLLVDYDQKKRWKDELDKVPLRSNFDSELSNCFINYKKDKHT